MKLSHLLSFTMQLVFSSSTPVTRLDLFLGFFLNESHFFFKEPTGKVCHTLEAFSCRGCILLELEMISFLPIILKLFFRVARSGHLLRVLSRFYSHF